MSQIKSTNEIFKSIQDNLKNLDKQPQDFTQAQIANLVGVSTLQALGSIALNTAVIADCLEVLINLKAKEG